MTDLTPMQVERRLIELGRELDEANDGLHHAEHTYMNAKGAYEIATAKWRMKIRGSAADRGVKITVGEIDDEAMIRCQDELTAYYTSEAIVKAARANMSRVRTQIEIARSVGASVRTSMESL